MRKSKFTEEQIINLLKSVEAGQKVADVAALKASVSRPITGGKLSTAGSMSTRPDDSSTLRMKTGD
jgi:hypothetical protein